MKVIGKFGGVCVALLIGMTCLSASSCAAQAKAHPVVRPAFTAAQIYLGRSHGYGLGLSMPNPKIAVLYAFRIADGESVEGGNYPQTFTQAVYAVRVDRDLLGRGVIRAVFPTLGRLSLRFRPSGKRKAHALGHRCHGKPQVTEYGAFRGTISLRGEGGYFQVARRSVGGVLTLVPRAVCRSEAEDDAGLDPRWQYVASGFGFIFSPGSGSIALLYAAARTPSRTIGIRVAHREGAPAGADVNVQVLELRHGMAIGRSIYGNGEAPGTFSTSLPGEHPATATLKPPTPFQGEAAYLENSPSSHSWTGDLSVTLPGAEVPLTGRRFKTSLCVVSPLKVPDGCDFLKPKLIGNARLGLSVPGGIGG
jgi:hypothetical protein